MALKSFAHLLGIKKPRGDEGEDDEKAKKAKGKRAEDDDRDESAEDDADDADAAENDDDADAEDDEEKPEGKKAKGKRAEDDEDDADAKVAKGRRMERERCAKIFGSKAAGVRPDMAASLAFGTSLSASEAIAQLNQAAAFGAPPKRGMSLDERMQGVQKHRLAPDAKAPEATGSNTQVTSMVSLYNQAKGVK